MDVEDAALRQLQDRGRDDLPVGDHHDQLRLRGGQPVHGLRSPDPLGLEDRESQLQGRILHRRRGQAQAVPRAIRLGQRQRDAKTGAVQRRQCDLSELGRTGKCDVHPRSSSRAFLSILVLMRSRFSALR